MRTLHFLVILPLLVSATPLHVEDKTQGAASKTGFIRIENGILLGTDGEPTYLAGMNHWNAMSLAAPKSAGGNFSRFKEEVRQLASFGINHARIMAASEGSQFGIQPFRMNPALMESPGVYNEPIFVGLDRAIAVYGEYNMSVTLTMNNFWEWSGGAAQYVSWATNTTIPYGPHRWDPTLNPPFGNWTSNGTRGAYDPELGRYDGFLGYAGRFYNDTSITNLTQKWYKHHIATVMDRVNTVTGVRYRDDPTISTVEHMNEPQDPSLEWVAETADFMKTVAPNHLVTLGYEGKTGEWWWKRVHSPKNIDYACGGWYNETDPSQENLDNATSFATRFIEDMTRWGKDIGKLVVMEEFGIYRDEWENVQRGAPTKFYLYDASAGTTRRDVYFELVISKIVEYFKRGEGWVGAMPWAYGGSWRPTDERNEFNEAMAGDPPHEPPGFYDLYYEDASTMEILAEQVSNVTSFLLSGGCVDGRLLVMQT